MNLRPTLFLIAPLIAPLLLAGCGDDKPLPHATPVTEARDAPVPSLDVKNADSPKVQAGSTLSVNAYLWRGALDTLSFMPLVSADPFGGTIVTGWFQPTQVKDERFKATAYILGRELRADAIKISLFRQTLQNGQWVDADVSSETTGELEDKVLARARELREKANQ
jgi:hypothetical protein